MNLEVEETGPVERRLRIEVTTAEVDAAFDEVYRQFGRTAKLKGFRPGRVPRPVLQRYFGAQARAEVLERVVRESLSEAIERSELPVLGEPRLEPESQPEEGTPFVYAATVEIRPVIELKRVRGLEVVRPRLQEPETDPVESYLEELRAGHAQLLDEAEGSFAARGHVAVIDYEGSVDGEPFAGGSGRETQVELGSGSAIAGFEEQLEGLTVGASREFDVDLPDPFPQQELAGRTAHFRVELKALKRKELPDLDDEFAKDVSEFETLDALRADLRAKVEAGRERQRKALERDAVRDALVQANPFPVPESLVERELGARIARAVSQLQGIPTEQLREHVTRLQEEWRPQAARAVKLALLVPEVAKAEDISLSEEEVDARLVELAEQQERPVAELRRSLSEQGMLDALRAGMLEERVVEFATAEANLVDS